ncbi:SGNH/GDSL hydrolase family protein [Skermania sp. ID1734]|uniref:SGNH/GDSL hydrolase family protein n=1 Tax=Skermania sp. ID1734 TaxID=2597516 RepID=UPI00163D7EFE|nr:SGNH/GDSL hydrolase family protein [Skermania sp. ID1734]
MVGLVVSVGISGPAAADPAPGAAVITLGDSFTATAPLSEPLGGNCMHPPTSWPGQLAADMGIAGTPAFQDFSCNGAAIDTGTGWTLLQQARAAAPFLGPGTRAVLIQLGFNDAWGSSARAFPSFDCLMDPVRGCDFDAVGQARVPDFRAVTSAGYAERVRTVIDYVRYFAPHARVVFVGYPAIFARPGNTACWDVAVIGHVVQPRAQAYLAFLDALDAAQRDAARILGIDYFNARAVTAGHESCSPEPWIGGLTSLDSLTVGAPLHPTPFGNGVVAAAMKRQFAL